VSRPVGIDSDRLAALLAVAIRLGVAQLPGQLRQQGTAGGVELLLLQSLAGSGEVRTGQCLRAGDETPEGGAMPPLAHRYVDAGRLLGVSESTVKRLVAAGSLRAINVGGSRRIPQAALESFVARQAGTPSPTTEESQPCP